MLPVKDAHLRAVKNNRGERVICRRQRRCMERKLKQSIIYSYTINVNTVLYIVFGNINILIDNCCCYQISPHGWIGTTMNLSVNE